ncbi:hypothetical protein Tco_1025184 [Tanacetum coccineum]
MRNTVGEKEKSNFRNGPEEQCDVPRSMKGGTDRDGSTALGPSAQKCVFQERQRKEVCPITLISRKSILPRSKHIEALSESEDSGGGHWKSRKKRSNREEDNLSQSWKKCIKDPIELHNIKQRDGESTEDFMKRYKLESKDVKGAPKCMRISRFMHGITNPELIKRLHDKIPKVVDEMMRVTTSFLRGEVATSNHERKKSFLPWKQQEGSQKQNFRKGSFRNQQRPERKQDRRVHEPEKADRRNAQGMKAVTLNKRTQTEQRERTAQGSKKRETFGKDKVLAILMVQPWERVARQKIMQSFSPKAEIFFPPLDKDERTEGPMIIEAETGGHCIHCMYVDGGSSSEILYEHYFSRLRLEIKNQLVPTTTPLIGFSGEIIWPIGQIQLLVTIGDEEHSASAWMNFVVVRSPSPYNEIIERPGVRKLQAVLSTAHEMLKILIEGGVITLKSIRLVLLECAMVSGPEGALPVTKPIVEERIKVAINLKYPEQTVMIGSAFIEEDRNRLCSLL